MGWMSWEIFRCDTDCDKDPANCISERLYKEQARRLASSRAMSIAASRRDEQRCQPPR